MSYLRVTLGRWKGDLSSEEASQESQEVVGRIRKEGLEVLRQQPGFMRLQVMKADSRTLVAVVEWQSERLGVDGAEVFRSWLHSSGVADKLRLETYAGDVIVTSEMVRG